VSENKSPAPEEGAGGTKPLSNYSLSTTQTQVQLQQYAACVFESGDTLEIRLLPSGRSTWMLATEMPDLAEQLATENQRGQNIYGGGNPRKTHGGRKAADVALARTVFVDFDGITVDETRRRIEVAKMPIPTLMIASGHGVHCYWRLTEPLVFENEENVELWRDLQRKLIATLDSDKAIHDLPRIMRLPGFQNHKAPVARCFIVDADPTRVYDLAELPAAMLHRLTPNTQPAPHLNRNTPRSHGGNVLVRAQKYFGVCPGVTKGKRNSEAYHHAAQLISGFELNDEEAWPILLGWNSRNAPPLGEEELEKCLNNARSSATHPPGELANAMPPQHGGTDDESESKRETIANRIVKLSAAAKLFHNAEGDGFATVPVGGHFETWRLRSRSFRQWVSFKFYETEGKAPSAQATQDALAAIEGKAIHASPEHAVHLRVAEHGDAIYLDLSNTNWQAVEVTATGWRVVESDAVPIKFRRARGVQSLPIPTPGGQLETLRQFINVKIDNDWILLVAWLVGAFNPRGPYPVLLLNGEQGSGKSTVARVMRRLMDPNLAPLRSEPASERDLAIAAHNGRVLGFDNFSRVKPWLSDALCRLATGGGFATRKLYSDDDETIFSGQRPVIINGIPEIATAPDLLDRAIQTTIPQLPDTQRKTEREFWADFCDAAPGILGGLLDAVACGLRRRGSVKLATPPRMADFAQWIVACEPALPWAAGEFLAAYADNRANAHSLALEASVLGRIILSWLVTKKCPWSGSASALLAELKAFMKLDDDAWARKKLAAKPNTLSGAIRRLAPELRAVGIEVDMTRNKHGSFMRLWKKTSSLPSASTLSAIPAQNRRSPVTMGDDNPKALSSPPNSPNGIKNVAGDDSVGSLPTFSPNDDHPTDAARLPGYRPPPTGETMVAGGKIEPPDESPLGTSHVITTAIPRTLSPAADPELQRNT